MWNRRSSRAPEPLDAQAALLLQKLVYCSDRPQSAAVDPYAVMMTCIAPNSESIKASITLHVMMTPVTSSVRKQALNCACVFSYSGMFFCGMHMAQWARQHAHQA